MTTTTLEKKKLEFVDVLCDYFRKHRGHLSMQIVGVHVNELGHTCILIYFPPEVRYMRFRYEYQSPQWSGAKAEYHLPEPHRYMIFQLMSRSGGYTGIYPYLNIYTSEKVKDIESMKQHYIGSYLPNNQGYRYCEGLDSTYINGEDWCSEEILLNKFFAVLDRYYSSVYNQHLATYVWSTRSMFACVKYLDLDDGSDYYKRVWEPHVKDAAAQTEGFGVWGIPYSEAPFIYAALQANPNFFSTVDWASIPVDRNTTEHYSMLPKYIEYNLPRLRNRITTAREKRET